MKNDNRQISKIDLPFLLRILRKMEWPHKLGICDAWFGRRLAERGIGWVQTHAGSIWKLDLKNSTHRWIVYGYYEGAPFWKWARHFLRPSDIIVDSGANIGQTIVYFSQICKDGEILAFEPGAFQANWLAECLQVNPGLPVRLFRNALGDRNGMVKFQIIRSDGAQSCITDGPGEDVEIRRLEDVLKEQKVERVRLWKLDVEGYEVQAIAGADGYLKERKIDAVYAEMYGQNGLEIRKKLKSYGYNCYLFDVFGRLQSYEKTRKPDDHTNGLFLL